MSPISYLKVVTILFAIVLGNSNAQLSPNFYDKTCPDLFNVVRDVATQAYRNEARIAAKIIRLHFHDCFVNGCDASNLLDDADGVESEKKAVLNLSTGGYEVIDDIKAALEKVCPGVVSCADIVALASQILVSMSGGPSWEVQLGRRDGRAANLAGTPAIPGPRETLQSITKKVNDVGLNSTDLVALLGVHTFGRARCTTFQQRLYNFNGTGKPDPTIDASYLQTLQQTCPNGGNGETLVNFDPTTPDKFDNNYYTNLKSKKGLLQTDQALLTMSGADATAPVVDRFASSESDFFKSFGESLIRMGNINVLTGRDGEIRKNCRRIN